MRPIPSAATRWYGVPAISRPRNRTLPALGFSAPAMHANAVDLPAPFGPINPVSEPSRDVQVDAVERAQRAEAFFEPAHRQQRFAHHSIFGRAGAHAAVSAGVAAGGIVPAAPRRRRIASTIVPTMPYGRSAAIRQMIAP